MQKELEYQSPAFKVIQCIGEDVITDSGEAVTSPWGGEVVIDPTIPDMGL